MAGKHLSMVRGLWAAGVLCLIVATAAGQTREQVEAWLEAEIDASYELIYPFPDFDGAGLSWVRERYVEGEALRRLEAELAGKPDHPDNALLEQSLRRERGEPFGTTYTLWSDGEDRWRINKDYFSNDMSIYWDAAYVSERQWWLTSFNLSVFEPGKIAGHSSSIRGSMSPAISDLLQLLTGYLSAVRNVRLQISHLTLNENSTFSFLASLPDATHATEYAVRYEASWSQQDKRGFITSAILQSNGMNPRIVGRRYQLDGWHYDSILSCWIAREASEFDPRGTLTDRLRFVSSHLGSPEQIDRITAIPPIDGADPIRGSLTATRLTDYRRNSVEILQNDGTRTSHNIPSNTSDANADIFRWIGWVVLACAGVAAGCLVHRRFRDH